MKFLLIILFLALAAPAVAQEPTLEQKWAWERTLYVSRILELEEELGKIKAQLAKQQVAAEQERLKLEIEQANPGYEWDSAKGALVPKGPR